MAAVAEEFADDRERARTGEFEEFSGIRQLLSDLHLWTAELLDKFDQLRLLRDVNVMEVDEEERKSLELLKLIRDEDKTDALQEVTVYLLSRAALSGASWVQAGEAMGMSPQGAYKMFKRRYAPHINSPADFADSFLLHELRRARDKQAGEPAPPHDD